MINDRMTILCIEDDADTCELISFVFKQASNILKSDSNITARNESRIPLNRPGGKVRLPSGQILHILTDGLHMPEPGKRYLMFLEYDEKSRIYEIITGYQYREGRIESLDGINLDGDVQGAYSNYPKYNGTEVGKFESLVLASIGEAKSCDKTNYIF